MLIVAPTRTTTDPNVSVTARTATMPSAAHFFRSASSAHFFTNFLSQAGPIVGNQDGIAGIGGIVFYAGGKSGDDALQPGASFQAGDILRRFVAHPRNRIAVAHKLAPCPRGFAFVLGRIFGHFYEVGDLSFDNTADLIQVSAPLPLDLIRVWRTAKQSRNKGSRDDRQGGRVQRPHVPLQSYVTQRPALRTEGSTILPSTARAFSQSLRKL